MAAHGGTRVNSGRKPGKVSEHTKLYRELMRGESLKAVDKLIAIRDDIATDPAVVVRICQWMCEQGYGKARQAIVHEDEDGNVVRPPAQINIIGENQLKEIIARTSEEVANQESEENNNV